MGSDFETQRQQDEAARRERAAARNAERRAALEAGARAPSHADGSDASGILRVASIGAGVLAAGALLLGLVTFGSPLAAIGLGGAAVFGATSFALARLRTKNLEQRSAADARLASLAASALTSAPESEQAWKRARAAVDAAADLDAGRRRAILKALEAAHGEVRAAASAERTAAFVARCDEIVASLGALPRTEVEEPSAYDRLDALATDLTQEASARAEVEEALRVARGAARRQAEG